MAEFDDTDEVFVYTGGDQVVPNDVRRVRIDKSVKIIPRLAFDGLDNLIDVEFHDGIERVGEDAFNGCSSLRGVILLGVKIIEARAFSRCIGLTEVELFGDKLETIEEGAFYSCNSLRTLTMPSIRSIHRGAFIDCVQLTDLEFGEELETIQEFAFHSCIALRRIAMPLKCVIEDDVFYNCPKLATVDLVGGIHNTVASLHLERWRNEMNEEIDRINQVLPDAVAQEKTAEIQEWMRSVSSQLDHYKAQHKAILKEATTVLELALWKANLGNNEGGLIHKEGVRITRGRWKRARKDICVTSGASILIKNVLPFLQLE
eukprot:scaffold5202_cov133-Skeletonema_dohrnii-CCMP3373.AAC.5